MDFVTLGELLIDMFPAETGRHFSKVTAFLPKPGGAPANVAVAGARLGAQTAFIGKVGNDFFGEFLRDVLRQENVDTRGLRFDDDARTTLAMIAQPSAQHNEYIFYRNPGADQRLRPDELDRALITLARALHIGSLSLSAEPSRSATLQAVQWARAAGALISFDVNFRPALWRSPDDARAQISALLPHTALVKVNETELELLTATNHVAAGSAQLLARGPQIVIVTLGAQGSYFRTARADGFIPALPVTAIDSTGCGDAFVGALLTQLTRTDKTELETRLPAALRFANAAGALTATRRGAIPALPTYQETLALLAAHDAAVS